jgi:hypothetical protein
MLNNISYTKHVIRSTFFRNSIRLGCGAISAAFNGGKKEQFISKLNIPENYTPFYAVLLGYSDSTPSKGPKRKANTVQYVR